MSIVAPNDAPGKMPVCTVHELARARERLRAVDEEIIDLRILVKRTTDIRRLAAIGEALTMAYRKRFRIQRQIQSIWMWEDHQTLSELIG